MNFIEKFGNLKTWKASYLLQVSNLMLTVYIFYDHINPPTQDEELNWKNESKTLQLQVTLKLKSILKILLTHWQ